VLALFLDGVVVAGQTVIVVLGLTRRATSARWGCAWVDGERRPVHRAAADLLGRGLVLTERCCACSTAARAAQAVQDVLGTAAVIQRCQLHKARNLQALLPKARQATSGQ